MKTPFLTHLELRIRRGASLSIALALALQACAGSRPVDCAMVDWTAAGRDDGADGSPAKAFNKRVKQCEGDGADEDAYRAGRVHGLASYCAPPSAFAQGLTDARYRGVCAGDGDNGANGRADGPDGAEADFLAAYAKGQRLADLTREAEKASRAHARARTALERHRYQAEVAANRADAPNIDGVERERADSDAAFHLGEVERLTKAMPGLEARLVATRETLETFRESLPRALQDAADRAFVGDASD